MDEKYLEALEFDKIRARAADGIVCPEARGMLLGQPAWETPDEVRAALEQTDAMTTLLIKTVRPVFPRWRMCGVSCRERKRAACSPWRSCLRWRTHCATSVSW